MKLRETDSFVVRTDNRGIMVTAKARAVYPPSRVLALKEWAYLKPLSDTSFDSACVWDYHIGVWQLCGRANKGQHEKASAK